VSGRRKTKRLEIGGLVIGGGAPVVVEGMLKEGRSYDSLMSELERLVAAGCELVRVALPSRSAVSVFKRLVAASPIPVMADVHFSWALGRSAIDAGAPSVRVNPGNMRIGAAMRSFARQAASAGVVVRVGSNSGSVSTEGSGDIVERLVDSVLEFVSVFEDEGLDTLIVGAKSSSVAETVEANRAIAARCGYPLHIGVTATGVGEVALIKSAAVAAALLLEGLGDTLRVSLTDSSDVEVRAARRILQALGLRRFEPEIISCPTCSRCRVDLREEVMKAEKETAALDSGIKIAIMGCVVNGPGEGREADFGVAFGARHAVLFAEGKRLGFVPNEEALKRLLEVIDERRR